MNMKPAIAEAGADDKLDEKPLDPAVERVRRKLIRFAVINLVILFGALAIVVVALFLRGPRSKVPTAPATAQLSVPVGAQVISHNATLDALSLLVSMPDNSRQLLVFDPATGNLRTRYTIVAAP